MSYVEVCQTHGQYHGDYCGGCVEDLREENTKFRIALDEISKQDEWEDCTRDCIQIAIEALKDKK